MSIQFHNDPHAYVAHYTRADIALDYILRNETLRLGPLTATNDPRETKTWVFAVSGSPSSQSESAELRRLAKDNKDYTRLLKHGCKVLCVSCDVSNAQKLKFVDRCYGKARMWAQYAENHRGVCLVFDKTLLSQEIEKLLSPKGKLISGDVTYWDFDISIGEPEWIEHMEAFMLSAEELVRDGPEEVLRRSREKNFRTFFLQKNTDWKSEQEYRWIFFGADNEPEYIKIGTSLKGIIVGCDFYSTRLDEIRNYCKKYDAHFARIRWFNGIPDVTWVNPGELADSPLFA